MSGHDDFVVVRRSPCIPGGQADPPRLCCHPMRTDGGTDSIGPYQILKVVSVSNHLRKPFIMLYPALLITPIEVIYKGLQLTRVLKE